MSPPQRGLSSASSDAQKIRKILINIFESQNNNIYAFDNHLNLIGGFPKSSKFNGDFDISNNEIEFSFISDNNELEYHLVK